MNRNGVKVTHLSATAHEPLLAAAADFLTRQKDAPGILIVSRNKLAADELVYRNSHLGLSGVRRLSIEQLAQELSRKRLAEDGRTTATSLALDAITRKSVDAVAGGLKYFGSVADAPRFSGAVLRTLRELRLEGIESSLLSASGVAAADLGLLLDRYAQELGDFALADISLRLSTARGVAEKGKHHLCGIPIILLCPDVDHAAERDLLRTLIKKSPRFSAFPSSTNKPNSRKYLLLR